MMAASHSLRPLAASLLLIFSIEVAQTAASPPVPSRAPYVLPLRRESVPVQRNGQVVSHKTSYSGVITVGQPAQEFRVVFDTGSGHVVLPSTECTSKTCLVHRRYNKTSSASAVPVNLDGSVVPQDELCDQVTIGYGTGQVVGEFVKDKVCIGLPAMADKAADTNAVGKSGAEQPCETVHVVMAVEMSKKPFKSFKFDGILGLGLGGLALSKDFSFFDSIASRVKASSPHFGVFLTDGEDGDESEIALGGHNPDKLLGSLSWAPVVTPELGYWMLHILAVRVDGVTLDVCKDGSCRGVMDTGTSHLGIPSAHNDRLSKLLLQPADGISDCRNVRAPVVEFEFKEFNMTLHSEDYMRPLPLAEGVSVSTSKGVSMDPYPLKRPVLKARIPKAAVGSSTKYECRPRLMPVSLPEPLGPNLFILGEPVLHRYYTVFDWKGGLKGPQVGFGLASKRRYTNPVNMVAGGQVLRDDVKKVLHNANFGDEVILVQVHVAVSCRGRSNRGPSWL